MILTQESPDSDTQSHLSQDEEEELQDQNEPKGPIKLSELKPTSLLLSHQPLLSELDPRYACQEVSSKSLLKSSDISEDEEDNSESEDAAYFANMKQKLGQDASRKKLDSSEEESENNFSGLRSKTSSDKKKKFIASDDDDEMGNLDEDDLGSASNDSEDLVGSSDEDFSEESNKSPSGNFLDNEAVESDGIDLDDSMEDDNKSNDESYEGSTIEANKGKDFLDSEAEESEGAHYDDNTLEMDEEDEDECIEEHDEKSGSENGDYSETEDLDELNDSKSESIKSQDEDINSRSKKMFEEFSTLDSLEKKKSQAVQAQLGLLDNLLQMRTHIQGIIQPSNQLPPYDVRKPFVEMDDVGKLYKQVTSKLAKLLTSIVDFQHDLFLQNPQAKYVVETEDALDNSNSLENKEINLDEDDEEKEELELSDVQTEKSNNSKRKRHVQDVSLVLAKRHTAFKTYRDSTIEKWNDFIKSKTKNDSFAAFEQPTLKQIEQILSDKERLIKRTQVQRTTYKIIGKKDDIMPKKTEEELMEDNPRPQEFNPEIFDDDDFYHQLLRYLMEHPFAAAKDSEAFKKYQKNLEKLRKSLKKKVDTRASKGRKIRYTVHPKLVNFLKPRQIAVEQLCYPIYKYIAQTPP